MIIPGLKSNLFFIFIFISSSDIFEVPNVSISKEKGSGIPIVYAILTSHVSANPPATIFLAIYTVLHMHLFYLP